MRVCAAGMASAWSWRTWRRALTTDFPLDMRILGRFLVKLGEFDYRNVNERHDRTFRIYVLHNVPPAMKYAWVPPLTLTPRHRCTRDGILAMMARS